MKRPRGMVLGWAVGALLCVSSLSAETGLTLEEAFQHPPREARPDTYWLWLNSYVDAPSAKRELTAMKEAGLGGVLLFEMGARGDPKLRPPPGPAFLSPAWVEQLKETTRQAKALDLEVDMSVISSWDMGGPWIEPKDATMALYSTETSAAGGRALDLTLLFPHPEKAAPLGADGKPAFWTDVAVLAVRNPRRLPGHSFVIQLDPPGVHELTEVVLDQGKPNAPPELAGTMSPVREFSVAVSTTGSRDADFTEVLRDQMPETAGPNRFALPRGTRAKFLRLTLLSAHQPDRPHWTIGEFAALDAGGQNVAGSRFVHDSRDGAALVRAPVPLSYHDWNAENIFDGSVTGPDGVFATAGFPPFDLPKAGQLIDVTSHVDRDGRLRWQAPEGEWTFLRYVCMVTGERLKVPGPASDGLASDHLNPEATRVHMDEVIRRLQAGFGDLRKSGLTHLYLASYEVVGKVWSPVFAGEFQRRRGYSLARFLPALFGARVDDAETTERFLFDYTKTLGEVVVDAYYGKAREIARAAGLTIKSEAGGPGPPIHTPPFDALLANGAVDAVQGEFWPYWPEKDAIWVVKEPASAAHIYGRRIVHLESFTSFQHWGEGPQDLKASADRAFTEGGNHIVWHTWTHQPPGAGLPGWAYGAGTHLDENEPWWSEAKPFLDYLARCSALLQRGNPVSDVLYYYGDGGANFVRPRRNPVGLGPGFDYDVTNADVILHRLEVRDGRLSLPDGTSYALLVLPDRADINVAVLEKIERLVAGGATVIGPRPQQSSGLEGFPDSDARVRELAARLWKDLDGKDHRSSSYGRGRVFSGVPEREVLAQLGIQPDFVAGPALDFIHRRDGRVEIYFVRNREASGASETLSFRAGALTPEIWDPRTGAMTPVTVFQRANHRVEIPIELAGHGAAFVVFRDEPRVTPVAAVSGGATITMADGKTSLRTERNGRYEVDLLDGRRIAMDVDNLPAPRTLAAGWSVTFSSPLGAPAPLALTALGPWTRQPDPSIRFFSGSGKYHATFDLPAAWRHRTQRVFLDLGGLWEIGEVWVNGQGLGAVWTEPFRVDCTAQLHDGMNEVEVEVVNTWHNRLVGEAKGKLPRATRTNIDTSHWKPWKELEVIESGLFGPVRLIPVAVRNLPE